MLRRKKGRKKKRKVDIGTAVSSILFGGILLGFLYVSAPSDVDTSSYDNKVGALIGTAKETSTRGEALSGDWYMEYLTIRGELEYIAHTKIRQEDKALLNEYLVRLDTAYYLLKDR